MFSMSHLKQQLGISLSHLGLNYEKGFTGLSNLHDKICGLSIDSDFNLESSRCCETDNFFPCRDNLVQMFAETDLLLMRSKDL